MPKEEPAHTGFTNSGYPKSCAAFSTAARDARLANTALRGTSTPASAASLCALSLSMHRALARVPQPIMGTPAISSMPCTVPSSPFLPCKMGNAASKR